MYVSKIRVVAGDESDLARLVKTSLEELGYIFVQEDPEIIIAFLPLEEAIREVMRLRIEELENLVVIDVTNDGNYVIPLLNESRGGSIIGSLVADLMGAQLVLTSRTAQLGLTSVYEFTWINGLEPTETREVIELDRRLISRGELKVFPAVQLPIKLSDGYRMAASPEEADIVIGDPEYDGANLKPLDITVGLVNETEVPDEVLYFSIANTLKSLNLHERRINFVIAPSTERNRERLASLGKKMGASTIFVKYTEMANKSLLNGQNYTHEYVCESLLRFMGTRVILRGVKRAYGVVTCLGVK